MSRVKVDAYAKYDGAHMPRNPAAQLRLIFKLVVVNLVIFTEVTKEVLTRTSCIVRFNYTFYARILSSFLLAQARDCYKLAYHLKGLLIPPARLNFSNMLKKKMRLLLKKVVHKF